MKTISNTDNVIDSRNIVKRIDELTGDFQALVDDIEAAETDEEREMAFSALSAWLVGHTNIVPDLKALEGISFDDVSDWAESDDAYELKVLLALASEADCSPDWSYGETLIHEDYFTDYIEELINDCYELPKEFTSGAWPWCHMTIDYEAAADEAKQDYMEVNFDGATYYIRG